MMNKDSWFRVKVQGVALIFFSSIQTLQDTDKFLNHQCGFVKPRRGLANHQRGLSKPH